MAGYAFPLPFTVICELLGIPEPDRADLGRWFRTLLAPHSWPPPAEAVAASDAIVGYLTALLDHKRAEPGEDLVTDLVVAADRDGALTPTGDALHDLPARSSPGTTPPPA